MRMGLQKTWDIRSDVAYIHVMKISLHGVLKWFAILEGSWLLRGKYLVSGDWLRCVRFWLPIGYDQTAND